MLQLVLRFFHVFFGALWVGMMVFGTFFMGPAIEEAGPDGGKVMAGMVRRGVMVIMPLFGLITIISGMWLFSRLSGGNMGALMDQPVGKAFGWGGLSALIAFLIGVAVMRPLMMKAQRLAASKDPAAMPEITRLRARANLLSRVVIVLMLFTLAAMSVARYL